MPPGFGPSPEIIVERVGLDHAKALWALSKAGLAYIRETIREHDIPADERDGWLYVSKTDRSDAVQAEADRLPIASDSVDVIILPHVLEFAASPHRVLREAERVLIGEGHLLVLAFNPWSLWGVWRFRLGWRRRPPWNGRFYTVARIRDWLSLLDFDIVTVERFAFCPPMCRAAGRMECDTPIEIVQTQDRAVKVARIGAVAAKKAADSGRQA